MQLIMLKALRYYNPRTLRVLKLLGIVVMISFFTLQPTCIVGTKTFHLRNYKAKLLHDYNPRASWVLKRILCSLSSFLLHYSLRISRVLKRFFESSVYFDFHTTWRLKTKNVEMGKIVF